MADYVSATDVKTELADGNFGLDYDDILEALVTRASRAIDRLTGREDSAYAVGSDTTRYFTPTCADKLWIGELAAAPTSVSVSTTGSVSNYTALVAADYLLWPYNALLEGRPYRRIDLDTVNGHYGAWYAFPKAVKVVGKFGYSTTVPGVVYQATLVQTVRWFKRAQQGFQDTGALIDLGQLTYTQRLDPDVVTLLYDAGLKRAVV